VTAVRPAGQCEPGKSIGIWMLGIGIRAESTARRQVEKAGRLGVSEGGLLGVVGDTAVGVIYEFVARPGGATPRQGARIEPEGPCPAERDGGGAGSHRVAVVGTTTGVGGDGHQVRIARGDCLCIGRREDVVGDLGLLRLRGDGHRVLGATPQHAYHGGGSEAVGGVTQPEGLLGRWFGVRREGNTHVVGAGWHCGRSDHPAMPTGAPLSWNTTPRSSPFRLNV
jgi:hypothetical protein